MVTRSIRVTRPWGARGPGRGRRCFNSGQAEAGLLAAHADGGEMGWGRGEGIRAVTAAGAAGAGGDNMLANLS